MSIGSRIKSKRTERGFTRKELAEDVGVTERSIHRWENGTPEVSDIEHLKQLARALGVSLEWLMGGASKRSAA